MMRTPAHPGLYDVEADPPILNGTTCSECGRVYFPPLGIGCEACGAAAERLLPIPVAASGTVHSLAQVHLHRGQPPVPFTIAEIRLDDGPLIRGTLGPDADGVGIGDPVSATWAVTATQDDGAQVVEPAFVPTIAASSTGAAS
ncbi:zinc ribbon domain-containing protein [Streptomyces sp. NPDC048415]|uniref:Zn-ribbon domain-containing OB-fold protein n=1 Tax=Streptomyces sp. NPDC048415 TaxID=3154822 RepID=UPI0034240009